MNLEDKFFYRLVKAAYYALLIPLVLMSLLFGYDFIPTKYVDNQNSYLVCETGFYRFEEVGISLESKNAKSLTGYYDHVARRECAARRESGAQSSYSYSEFMAADPSRGYIQRLRAEIKRRAMVKQESPPPYVLSLEYETTGAWSDVFFWWFVVTSGLYAVLNIIQEALIYVAFGVKPTWVWLVHAKGAVITAVNIAIEVFSSIKGLINKKFPASWGEKDPL